VGKQPNHRRNAGKPEPAKPDAGADLQRKGKLLWAQRDIPWLVKSIRPEWLKTNGFHEIEADLNTTSSLIREDRSLQQKLNEIRADNAETEMTHSVAINLYPATLNMPQLTIVVIDTIPVELKRSYMVWSWFIYVLALICCW
jgi:two-component system sensor histidine kinase PhoQ